MLSYSRCVVPVLCNLKSVKVGAAWHARQLPILPADSSCLVGEVADEYLRKMNPGIQLSLYGQDYNDQFEEKIMALVEKKARDGKIEDVEGGDAHEARQSADVIDLTELLKRSLGAKTPAKAANTTTAKPASARKRAAKPATEGKAPARRSKKAS